MQSDMSRRLLAEFFGTLWLVCEGCGSAVLAAGFSQLGIGFPGVAFAFGLTVLSMAYAVGHISGGHFNPAVTLCLWCAGRCANKHLLPYIAIQVVGGALGAGVLTEGYDSGPNQHDPVTYVGKLQSAVSQAREPSAAGMLPLYQRSLIRTPLPRLAA